MSQKPTFYKCVLCGINAAASLMRRQNVDGRNFAVCIPCVEEAIRTANVNLIDLIRERISRPTLQELSDAGDA